MLTSSNKEHKLSLQVHLVCGIGTLLAAQNLLTDCIICSRQTGVTLAIILEYSWVRIDYKFQGTHLIAYTSALGRAT